MAANCEVDYIPVAVTFFIKKSKLVSFSENSQNSEDNKYNRYNLLYLMFFIIFTLYILSS